MKLTIIKKTVKEGVSERTGSPYRIASLFVKFDDRATYDRIVSHLRGKGATDEQIEKFCKPGEHNGKVNYAFGLNCSNYTFDKVEQFGELDANINFTINDAGFINAKIHIVDRREQVNGYTPPESEVEGWNIPAPAAVESKQNEAPPMPKEFEDFTWDEAGYEKGINAEDDDIPF